jgi:BMFP domain-containing protein YqiC
MEDTQYLCKRCGYKGTTKASLVRHLQSKKECPIVANHIGREELIKHLTAREYKTQTTVCEFCNKTISKPVAERHKRTCQEKSKQISKQQLVTREEFVRLCDVLHILKAKEREKEKQIIQLHSALEYLKPTTKLHVDNATIETDNRLGDSKTYQTVNKKKKSKITQAMRIVCWNTHIGEEVGKTLCLCCKTNSITQHNFHCGHIVAEANGGLTCVDNLRPICAVCNNSMGTSDMKDFAITNFKIQIE